MRLMLLMQMTAALSWALASDSSPSTAAPSTSSTSTTTTTTALHSTTTSSEITPTLPEITSRSPPSSTTSISKVSPTEPKMSTTAPKKDITEQTEAEHLTFPMVLPPVKWSGDKVKVEHPLPCMLYLEGINIHVMDRTDKGSPKFTEIFFRDDGTPPDGGEKTSNLRYLYEKGHLNCATALPSREHTQSNSTIRMVITPGGNATMNKGGENPPQYEISDIDIELTFVADTSGLWGLRKAELMADLSVKIGKLGKTVRVPKGRHAHVQFLYLTAAFGYAWNCWDTQALFFSKDHTNTEYVGISFHGLQVQVLAYENRTIDSPRARFSSKVESCTPTFSIGSLMGIIVSLIMFTFFIFAFLMLNSIQTMDRFDNPKKPQLIINARD